MLIAIWPIHNCKFLILLYAKLSFQGNIGTATHHHQTDPAFRHQSVPGQVAQMRAQERRLQLYHARFCCDHHKAENGT